MNLSGVLPIDKQAGMTSHDVVGAVRRLFGTKQVGHTGTLDPMATGVLTLLVGRAVKASDCLLACRKRYEALLKLGIETDTEDTTGKTLKTCADLPEMQTVFDVCKRFSGQINQTPPMYSALKKNGKKLVDLARAGIEVERAPRLVTIEELTVRAENEKEGLYALSVLCSEGTYIRTLCADIGRTLGCGGAMAALRRTENGRFSLSNTHTLRELEALSFEERVGLLLPTESVFDELPKLLLPPFYRKLASSGCPVYLRKLGVDHPVGARLRLYDGKDFFALGEVGVYEEGIAVKAVKQFILYDKDGKPLC